MDLFARRVLGWQVADHLRSDLALDAAWSIIPTGVSSTRLSVMRSGLPGRGPSGRWAARAIRMIMLPRKP
jgi:hypothetical protein